MGDATVSSFPDGETYVKINENIRGRDVFIVQPTCPPTNQNLMELLIMVDAARRASAARITAVIPFFGYARQDRKDQPRVPITAKLVANLLIAAGVNRVLTMDLHAQQVAGFFDIPVDHLFAAPVLIRHLLEKKLENPVVVAPDVGGVKMADAYSQALGCQPRHRGQAPQERHRDRVAKRHRRRGRPHGRHRRRPHRDRRHARQRREDCSRSAARRDIIAGVSHAVLSDLGIERLKDSADQRAHHHQQRPGRARRTACRSPRSASPSCWARGSSASTATSPSPPFSKSTANDKL